MLNSSEAQTLVLHRFFFMGPGRGRNQLENDVNRRCVYIYVYVYYIVFYEVQICIENILGEQDLWTYGH